MPAENAQVIDHTALEELKDVMEDEFPLLIETFMADSVLRIQTLKEAVGSEDIEAIRRAAHSFKGSASNLGAQQLTLLCKELEEHAHNGEMILVPSLTEQIIEAYNKACKELTSFT